MAALRTNRNPSLSLSFLRHSFYLISFAAKHFSRHHFFISNFICISWVPHHEPITTKTKKRKKRKKFFICRLQNWVCTESHAHTFALAHEPISFLCLFFFLLLKSQSMGIGHRQRKTRNFTFLRDLWLLFWFSSLRNYYFFFQTTECDTPNEIIDYTRAHTNIANLWASIHWIV